MYTHVFSLKSSSHLEMEKLKSHCFVLILHVFISQLSLAKACANGNQLGLEVKASNEIVCQLFQASHAANKQKVFSVQKGLNDTMR